MKKTYKTYEAPKAEVIEMQMPTVLMASGLNWDPTQGFEP